MTQTDIKSMQLYPRPERILADLAALGYPDETPLDMDVLTRLDQLHYHGTDALDEAIKACGIAVGDAVLEVGSGWGGCARYIAHRAGAHVTAVELQADYNRIARHLTDRTGMQSGVRHVNADFLALDLPAGGFDHVVSWLALFHIPKRDTYLRKIQDALRADGSFFAEDLYLITPPPDEEQDDFQRHLYPNSLVDLEQYHRTLTAAGFEKVESQDMTASWTAFTKTRLHAFRDNKASYERVHGAENYAVIEMFYDKMAGYFERGIVGGLRIRAQKHR
ncbi:SAM-dependent methyltransferase [Roseovarius sp. 2305UL8-3]|uniref:SAM-dependent methyltransferase n=1 Tax=Roseovarius conchicola TaxID=3121636 RepID=UPI003528DC7B